MITNSYELRLFDQTLLTFRFIDDFSKDVEIIDFDNDAFDLFPLGLKLSNDGLYSWLDTRALPVNRQNTERICEALGIMRSDLESIYRIGMGLSLTDSYWIVPKGFDGSFDEFNLFENGFSEALGAVACTGHPAAPGSLHGLTPDLVTDGTLAKAWRISEGGTRSLWKSASEGSFPGEPLSEFLASQIGEAMGIGNVHYDLGYWNNQDSYLCSICSAFTTKDVSYVPFAIATGTTGPVPLFRYAQVFGDECFEQICTMLAFDALICNTDRHWTNFGFLRDNHTGKLLDFAPVFDNGRGLFYRTADEQLGNLDIIEPYLNSIINKGSFMELASSIMGEQQQAKLALLGNLRFERDSVGAFSDTRYTALEDFIRHRAEAFCDMKTVDHQTIKEVSLERFSKAQKEDAVTFRAGISAVEQSSTSLNDKAAEMRKTFNVLEGDVDKDNTFYSVER